MSHETIAIEEKIAHLVTGIQAMLDQAGQLADNHRETRSVREETTAQPPRQQAA